MIRIALVLLVVAAIGPWALADDITLKNGTVLTNVKVLKKTETRWRIQLGNGQKKWIKVADIMSTDEKKTTGEIFDEKAKALGKKDYDGMVELGRWGLENDAILPAKKLLQRVIKKDKEHAEARRLLGHEKCQDGRWRYGLSLKKYKNDLLAKERKAQGWVLIDKEWKSPFEARRLKAGLVKDEEDGVWRTPFEVEQRTKGLFYFEGAWYDKSDREKLDQGMRKIDGEWVKVRDLDAKHRDPKNPWVIETEHFLLTGTVGYMSLSMLARQVEQLWQPLTDIFLDAPLTVDRKSKVRIQVERSQADAAKIANAVPKIDPRQDVYNERIGGVAMAAGGGLIHWHNESYSAAWVRHIAGQAFLIQLYNYKKLESPGFEMIGSYCESIVGGKYRAYGQAALLIKNWEEPKLAEALTSIDVKREIASSREAETMFARAGFATHYLLKEHRELTVDWFRKWAQGKAKLSELLEGVRKAEGDDLDKNFTKFRDRFMKKWKEPKL